MTERELTAIDYANQLDEALLEIANGRLKDLSLELLVRLSNSVKTKAIAHTQEAPDINQMVSNFLGWKLPDDFSPDAGITYYRNSVFKGFEPRGTNLFNADQAKAMIEYMLALPTNTEGK